MPSNPGERLRTAVIYCLAPGFVFPWLAVGSAEPLAELPGRLNVHVGLCHCLTRERVAVHDERPEEVPAPDTHFHSTCDGKD